MFYERKIRIKSLEMDPKFSYWKSGESFLVGLLSSGFSLSGNHSDLTHAMASFSYELAILI